MTWPRNVALVAFPLLALAWWAIIEARYRLACAFGRGRDEGHRAGLKDGRKIAALKLRSYAAACEAAAGHGHWPAAERPERQGMIAAALRLRQAADDLDPPA